MKHSRTISRFGLAVAAVLTLSPATLAAPTSAPPSPNAPDATFSSVVVDSKSASFPGLYNALLKLSYRGIEYVINTSDGGSSYTSAETDDGRGRKILVESNSMGEIMGNLFNMSVMTGIQLGANAIHLGSYDNLPGGAGAATFKEHLRLDGTGALSNPSSENAGKVKFDDVDGVNITGNLDVGGKVKASRFGQVYTLMYNTPNVPANSLSPIYSRYCNPGDIILSCGASGQPGMTAAFDLVSLRTYAYGSYCQIQLRNNWGSARGAVLINTCWSPDSY